VKVHARELPVRIAFAIVSLFPGGGLQRDCIEIARTIKKSGHDVTIYTSHVSNIAIGDEIPIVVFANSARTNHQKQKIFALDVMRNLPRQSEFLVGFDKLLGLDLLYCADASVFYRTFKRPYLQVHPRYRTFVQLEGDAFAPRRRATIILLSQNQLNEYRAAWHTEHERLIVIPPNVSLQRRNPDHRIDGTREKIRMQLNLRPRDWIWMTVGVQPKTKGLDRVVAALVRFPDARLLVAGIHETSRSSLRLAAHARSIGVSSRILWLGHREDISALMSAADVMLHPARYDTTGTVILEALVNGLPVIATSAAGYSSHIEAARAGIVVKDPFDFEVFCVAIDEARDAARRAQWSQAGIEYGMNPILYQGRAQAAEIMLKVASEYASAHASVPLPDTVRRDSNLFMFRGGKRSEP
jgi:UDP-glucose:(heptosyl)LPS alpha-1,3-glucosyltransferase